MALDVWWLGRDALGHELLGVLAVFVDLCERPNEACPLIGPRHSDLLYRERDTTFCYSSTERTTALNSHKTSWVTTAAVQSTSSLIQSWTRTQLRLPFSNAFFSVVSLCFLFEQPCLVLFSTAPISICTSVSDTLPQMRKGMNNGYPCIRTSRIPVHHYMHHMRTDEAKNV